jgi:hypothetical protein
MTIFDLIGYIGALVYIVTYGLIATKKITGDSVVYHQLNLIAPLCVLVSLYETFNAPSALIQSIWICISLFALFRLFKQSA